MQLTKPQRHNLKLYATYHAEPPAFWKLLKPNLWRYLVITVLLIFLFWLAPITGTASIAQIFLGIFIGVLLRDIVRFRQFVRVWPAVSEVLDWERLEELLNSGDSRAINTGDG